MKSAEEGADTSSQRKNETRDAYALNLGYRIEVHLPATKDVEVYNAIFRSLRDNILA
jgi:hypothetical protein